MNNEIINADDHLLMYTTNAGCSCKIPPAQLKQIIGEGTGISFANIIVGNSSADDAAVVTINEEDCIVSTTDFFTPIHNDAYTYGQIAAANAISDVYAMGAKPIVATAILAWPTEKLSTEIAAAVIRGATDKCHEAGIALAGGHSVVAPEPLFGLNVTGQVKKQHIKKNNTAQEGDIIYITKPIGLGILTSALKRNALLPEHHNIAEPIMTQLNSIGTWLGTLNYVTAMTDITGYGLAGHIIEMCDAQRLSVTLYWNEIPMAADLSHYIKNRILPDATFRNWQSYGAQVGFGAGVAVMDAFNILPDPQTSGGLCIAIKPEMEQTFLAEIKLQNPDLKIYKIGKFTASQEKTIQVVADKE